VKEMEVVEMNDWKILPLHWGPNTAAVQAIIDRVRTLTQEQRDEMNQRWDKIGGRVAYDYWWDAWREIGPQGIDWRVEALKVIGWLPAATDAIAAATLKGMISEDAYDSLMAIWEEVVGSEA